MMNVATGGRISLNELLATLCGPRWAPSRRRSTPSRAPGDVRDSQADISRAKRLTGYEPTVGLRDGLERTLAWYRSDAARNRNSPQPALTIRPAGNTPPGGLPGLARGNPPIACSLTASLLKCPSGRPLASRPPEPWRGGRGGARPRRSSCRSPLPGRHSADPRAPLGGKPCIEQLWASPRFSPSCSPATPRSSRSRRPRQPRPRRLPRQSST